MIWVVGNKGMLGSELSREFDRTGVAYVGSDREVDILDLNAITGFAQHRNISAIVNCAAYTAVDKAEDEPALCAKLNIDGPANLASLAQSMGARLIHISTDYVFSGDASRPYREDDAVNPQGTYGRTKAEGEKRVLSACATSIILRTAWLYGEFGPNFVYTMLKLMRRKDELGVVVDQKGSPTWARDLACAIVHILNVHDPVGGIYHYTDSGETSWYEFAVAIQAQGRLLGILEKECRIVPLSTSQYPTKTKRPAYSVLSKDKIVAEFHVSVPIWFESLKWFLVEVSGNKDALNALIG
jgi:dTDP-4-dehydrorhamnose reductase